MEWQSYSRFPKGNGEWEMVRPPMGRVIKGKEKVLKAAREWNAWDPLLVTTPESRLFLPPICVDSISDYSHKNVVGKQFAFSALLLLLSLVFVAYFLFVSSDEKYLRAAMLTFSGFCYVGMDTYFVQRNRGYLAQRALFVHWIFTRRNWFLFVFVMAMLAAGLGQLALESHLGGFDPLVMKYGVYFRSIESGEWWRHLYGPFIHAGLLHWVNNFVMGVIAAGLVGAIGKRSMALLFLTWVSISSIGVHYVQYIAESATPDSFVGVSGGIFGLFGWAISYSFRNSEEFPRHLWMSLALFTLLNIAITFVFLGNTSQVAHMSGLFVGAVSGIFGLGARKAAAPRISIDSLE